MITIVFEPFSRDACRHLTAHFATHPRRQHSCATSIDRLFARLSLEGEVAEWSKAPDSKSGIPATVSWVRIPPSPPADDARGRYALRPIDGERAKLLFMIVRPRRPVWCKPRQVRKEATVASTRGVGSPGYHQGAVTEWSKVHDWKSCVPQKGTEGSNPSCSANRLSAWIQQRRVTAIAEPEGSERCTLGAEGSAILTERPIRIVCRPRTERFPYR